MNKIPSYNRLIYNRTSLNIAEETEGDIEENEDMTDIEDPFFLKADSTIEINMEEVPAENHHSTNIMILLSN